MRDLTWTAAALLVGLAGCSSHPKTYDLQGEVSYEGKPVEQGKISFIPIDNTSGHSAVATIAGGRYQLPARWGLLDDGVYQVRIEGYRKTGRKERSRYDPTGPLIDVLEQFIPATYNSQSVLKMRVADLSDKSRADLQLGPTSSSR
jgi:hypothetical protein